MSLIVEKIIYYTYRKKSYHVEKIIYSTYRKKIVYYIFRILVGKYLNA